MSQLEEIPLGTQIVDKLGAINLFFRLRWEDLRTRFVQTPTIASYNPGAQTAAIATRTLYTALAGGLYRITVYGRVTIPDGVSSSFQVTIGFTDGVALTHVGANVNGDTTSSLDKFTIMVNVDVNSAITFASSYASNTPAKMTYKPYATVEQIGAA